MILADKILNLRKKNGWSQEELAEKVNVSRQSISKWEGASSIPDISKIIELASVFDVSTDYLLKDDFGEAETVNDCPVNDSVSNAPRISLDEAIQFINDKKEQGAKIAFGTLLCIFSPAILIFLAGFTDTHTKLFGMALSENLAAGLGITSLLVLVAVAVALFITSSIPMRKHKNILANNFETAYGVIGAVSEKFTAFDVGYTKKIVVGVMMCILSVVPLIIGGVSEAPDVVLVSLTSLMLVIIGIAVYIFVKLTTERNAYQQILGEGEYTKENIAHNDKFDRFSGFYWPLIVAAYLLWSFITEDWNITWIIWPVAALLFAALSAIFRKSDD